jgi:hypothetical protein
MKAIVYERYGPPEVRDVSPSASGTGFASTFARAGFKTMTRRVSARPIIRHDLRTPADDHAKPQVSNNSPEHPLDPPYAPACRRTGRRATRGRRRELRRVDVPFPGPFDPFGKPRQAFDRLIAQGPELALTLLGVLLADRFCSSLITTAPKRPHHPG